MRMIFITGEVVLLTALLGCLFGGMWLTLFDLGLRPKYQRAITMVLLAMGCLAVAFFVVHLISFYPT